LTRAKEIETVVVDDFDDECFSVDAASWGHIFPDRPMGESIDLKRLSVNHLWFATV
jgi:hypothetical protein